jgi:acyl carrier protein
MKTEHRCENESESSLVVDRIRRLISQVCVVDVADVGKNARLLAFGIDSVRVIELMMCIEEEFHIQLEQVDLGEIATVKQLADHVENLTALQHTE